MLISRGAFLSSPFFPRHSFPFVFLPVPRPSLTYLPHISTNFFAYYAAFPWPPFALLRLRGNRGLSASFFPLAALVSPILIKSLRVASLTYSLHSHHLRRVGSDYVYMMTLREHCVRNLTKKKGTRLYKQEHDLFSPSLCYTRPSRARLQTRKRCGGKRDLVKASRKK